jgi:hypothetical protein
MDLYKAVEFIRRTGNEVEQARLNYLLTNQRPAHDVVTKLFSGQRSDGGWSPFWAQDYSSLDATCFRLAQAEQMGLLGSETAIMRAVSFLTQRQSPDGSWEEGKKIANFAPTWARPGDLSARLYLTANCGFWLALLGDPDKSASKAANYLQQHLDQDGHLPSYLHTHWLAGGLWYKLNRHKSAERVFEYLDRRMADLAASHLSWLITTVCAAGSPPSHPLVDKAASLLTQSQQDDGRWPSEDGPSQDVHSTLEALRTLWLCGRVTKLS